MSEEKTEKVSETEESGNTSESTETKKTSESASTPTSTKIIIGVSTAAIVGLTAAVIALANKNNQPEPVVVFSEPPSTRKVLIDEENISEVLEQFEDRVEEGRFRVNMNTTWHFNSSDRPSYDAYVANNEANTHDIYFDVVRDDTKELIYSSPVIPLGKSLNEITLDKSLKAGTYECTLTYHLVNEKQETVSTLNISVNIIIEI